MRSPDRDHGLRVAGVGDADAAEALVGTALKRLILRVPLVAGCSDDDHAAGGEALALLADGSLAAGVIRDVVVDREAEVDAVDDRLVLVAVQPADELERRDDGELVSAMLVDDPQVVDVQSRRDSGQVRGLRHPFVGRLPIGGQNPRDVRSVLENRLLVHARFRFVGHA